MTVRLLKKDAVEDVILVRGLDTRILDRNSASMIYKRKSFFVGLILLTVNGLVSCQSKATPTLADLSQPGIGVGISDDSCPTVSVKVGQQISWTNQGKQDHVVRAESVEGQHQFDSEILQPGDSFTVTLTEPETYLYECSADGSLSGTITVEP